MNVEDIPALVEERVRQLRLQLFPQRLRLQLDDQWLSALAIARGKAGPGPALVVPLPEGICLRGMPQNTAALGDFIGDWLLEQGAIAAQVEVVLPASICQWRVLAWPFNDHPDQPLEALRQLQPDLGPLFMPLAQACLGWEPLAPGPGGQALALLVAAPRSAVEAWQEVFAIAGLNLQRLVPAQVHQWRALQPLWRDAPAAEHWFLDLGPQGSRLWLVVDGVPEADWPLPGWQAGSSFDAAWIDALQRCQRFWRLRAGEPPASQHWSWYGPEAGELLEQALTELVQPWPVRHLSLPDWQPGWDQTPRGADLLQELRGDQEPLAPSALALRRPLSWGAGIGAGLVAAMLLAAAALTAIQGSNQAEIARLLPAQTMLDGLQARLQRQRRQLRLLQRGNQALADGLVAVRSGSALLEDLRRRTPVGVQFTEVMVEAAILRLKGRATDPQAFARINALQLGLQSSLLYQPQAVQVVKANRDGATAAVASATAAATPGRQPVAFELTAAFGQGASRLDGAQLRALGAEGMAQRLALLQQAGVRP